MLLGFPVVLALSVCAIYLYQFGFLLSESHDKFGQFGDYFGGIVNPFLAFINIAFIAYFQRSSVAKSAEKDAVFRLLDFQRQIVASIEFQSDNKTSTGLQAFVLFDADIKGRYKDAPAGVSPNAEERLEKMIRVYEDYYSDTSRKQYLGHYFRSLYHIFKLIDSSDSFSDDDKVLYSKIVRAQLSHIEMKLLFLNCSIDVGKKFRFLVAKYNLLEWIDDKEFSNIDTHFGDTTVIQRRIASWAKLTS